MFRNSYQNWNFGNKNPYFKLSWFWCLKKIGFLRGVKINRCFFRQSVRHLKFIILIWKLVCVNYWDLQEYTIISPTNKYFLSYIQHSDWHHRTFMILFICMFKDDGDLIYIFENFQILRFKFRFKWKYVNHKHDAYTSVRYTSLHE